MWETRSIILTGGLQGPIMYVCLVLPDEFIILWKLLNLAIILDHGEIFAYNVNNFQHKYPVYRIPKMICNSNMTYNCVKFNWINRNT